MQKTASDHTLAIIKAGLSAVPVVGGVVASLIGDYIPTATQRSVEIAIDELGQRISYLENRLDPDAVDRDQFSELFKSCYLIIIRTHQSSKRRGAVALITNIMLRAGDPDKLTYTELDHYVHCLDVLSVGAIEILGQAVAITRAANFSRLGTESFGFSVRDLRGRVPRIEKSLLMGLVGELNALNLVHIGVPTTRIEQYGNYPLELTPLGGKFAVRLLEL
jgi:hypothetical protein